MPAEGEIEVYGIKSVIRHKSAVSCFRGGFFVGESAAGG
jgi:hypothetical protein